MAESYSDNVTTLDEFFEALPPKPYGLTERQVAFCRFLLEGNKGSQAARLAGYECGSIKSAGVEGSRLKSNPKIKQLLEAGRQVLDAGRPDIADKTELLQLLTRGARENDSATAKVKAMELLGRYHSLFNEGVIAPETRPPEEQVRKMPTDELIGLKQMIDREFEHRCQLEKRKNGHALSVILGDRND